MALKRLPIDGYAVLELNKVTFPKTGAIFAQYALGSDFSSTVPAENGMLLAIDEVAGEVALPAGATGEVLALHYSTEKLYNQQNQRLKDFALFPDTTTVGDANYPRLGVLALSDTFTTNCISYTEANFADVATLKTAIDAVGTTPLYGVACANGGIEIVAVKPTAGVGLTVIKATTLPSGDYAVKFGVMHV